MKKYLVEYYKKDKPKLHRLTELSKSGRRNGTRIYFWDDGIKALQTKFMNNKLYGINKEWINSRSRICKNPKNEFFTNWKKHKAQGIEVKFT